MGLKRAVLAMAALWLVLPGAGAPSARTIAIDYPEPDSIFPPEITAPTFLFRDEAAAAWQIEVRFADGAPPLRSASRGDRVRIGPIDPECVAPTNEPPRLTAAQAASRTWTPDPAAWDRIKRHSVESPAEILITGLAGEPRRAVSRGRVAIRTSKDPAGAPVFYRDVPLMPTETEKGQIQPLASTALPLVAW
jgi:hypothetical protein